MTKRTTESWEALLDGTTPGPWGCRWDEGHLAIVGPDEEAIAFDADERDSNLIVAAPEAVAEVVRLREELDQMRRDADKALKSRWGSSSYAEDIPTLRETSERAARILKGGDDE